jgi:hypothetical protein
MDEPKFSVGQILRYNDGPTALFRVSYISENHGGPGVHRYYGQHCMGGTHGSYESQCRLGNVEDQKTWYAEGRRKTTSGNFIRTPWGIFLSKCGNSRSIIGAHENN